jgi:putative ABC transport system substrate-binding protein
MRRREFVAGLAVTTLPPGALGQPSVPIIGFVGATAALPYASQTAAFLEGLSDGGYVDGLNIVVEFRWAENQPERLPALVADLLRRQVNVIATTSIPAALAAKAATSTTPIVFQTGFDPVEAGLVENLNRPGANLTGITTLAVELEPKRLELTHELIPSADTIAVLLNPTNPPAGKQLGRLQDAASALGVRLHVLHASDDANLEIAVATLNSLRVRAMTVAADAFFNSRSQQLARLALRHLLPVSYQFRDFAAAGGLLSYGTNLRDSHRLVGLYTARILRGERLADLPVQQSTKVELILNLKTAKTLGISVPPTLQAQADEVIE